MSEGDATPLHHSVLLFISFLERDRTRGVLLPTCIRHIPVKLNEVERARCSPEHDDCKITKTKTGSQAGEGGKEPAAALNAE